MIAEHDNEPVPGLPGALPDGEHILWQGAPAWRLVARRVFWSRLAIWYFIFLGVWRGLSLYGLFPTSEAIAYGLAILPVALAALGILYLLAWLTAKTTLYTITNRRVVMRAGIALPVTINVPFAVVGSANLRTYPDGSGDIPLEIVGRDAFSYFMLWPHLKPWRMTRPEPMLRGVPNASEPARILAKACTDFHEAEGAPSQTAPVAAAPMPPSWESVTP